MLILKNHDRFHPIGRIDEHGIMRVDGGELPLDMSAYSIGFGGEVLEYEDGEDGVRYIKKFRLRYFSIDPSS